jgi:hypothetical protein
MFRNTGLLVLLWLLTFCPKPLEARSRRHPKGPPFYIALKPHPEAKKVIASLPSGKFLVIEKEYDAKNFCNEQSLASPDQIEVFALNGRLDRVLVLCPGTLDGETNVATIFYPDREPVKKELNPPSSSHRVTDRQLQDAFKKLVAG